MSGNQSEDSINFQLIMEGFYYDAEIAYITEIVKNNLYFAVLESENNKAIKNSHDTIYFSIDEELIYNNYYFDFGPLNISCVYKYCSKLNKLLQYSQGLKRIVHYTTSNTIKRVNAAFLMGCYSIIYLNMDSKDIYRMLVNAGGSFKLYIDASQGVSQYTLRLSDCLQAIQKAQVYNFFNFEDFNVSDYDLHDQLQNGDMNWLLPRKFLAFIGPTDSDAVPGHTPEFYINYFLDNDIKTVIRLNNKVYDAMPFTKAGMDHYDLFFPDGTVPPKDILLKFLELAESSPAAIGVHCKAGLGRTGSLIGAYLIKHYRMTAREAIGWMRICRPGSVIGQQQGWLEKLESYLWKQGHHYRMQHYGEADKIPHHKHGIYSITWPIERVKLIEQAQQQQTEEKSSRLRRLPEHKHTKSYYRPPPHDTSSRSFSAPHKNPMKFNSFVQKPVAKISKKEDAGKSSKLPGRHSKNASIIRSNTLPPQSIESRALYNSSLHESTSKKVKPKISTRPREKSEFEEEHKVYKVHNFNNRSERERYNASSYEYYTNRPNADYGLESREVGPPHMSPRRSTQNRHNIEEETGKVRHRFKDPLEQTQGDKLNAMKAKNFIDHINTPMKKRPPIDLNVDEFNSKVAISQNQEKEIKSKPVKKSLLNRRIKALRT